MNEYEEVYSYKLSPKTPIIVRVDGVCFHNYLKHLEKPYCEEFANAMIEATRLLVAEIPDAKIGYTQSDEASILINAPDFADQWYRNRTTKIVSIVASMMTARFNSLTKDILPRGQALFDARAFTLPKEEVCNYFIVRQEDATKNSVHGYARKLFTQAELVGRSRREMIDMMFGRGFKWNDLPVANRRGVAVVLTKVGNKRVGTVDREPPIFSSEEGRAYIEKHMNI